MIMFSFSQEPALRFAGLSSLLILACTMATGVRAGDVAELAILGFSQSGGIFAFEEYGVQDGSGFPYANRYYIDTATDSYVKGTRLYGRQQCGNGAFGRSASHGRQSAPRLPGHRQAAGISSGGHSLR
jgi:predicted secreted protein